MMPNIAIALKAEIARISRKEIKGETEDFRKASAQYRAQIAALRRRIEVLEKQVKRASNGALVGAGTAHGSTEENGGVRRRFSSARLSSCRKKLGLSAADFGALIGVTGQSIYKWESGEARPRAKQLDAIASVRTLGKREAAARLQALRAAE
jgi:DNA-binding transcriptional regulator YiaG